MELSVQGFKINNKNARIEKRDAGIELLRILMMFFIICHHFFFFYIHEIYPDNKPLFFTKLFITSIITNGYIGVVCYIFISGYYGMKFKIKQLAVLLVQILFCSYLCLIILLFVTPYRMTSEIIFMYLFPVSSSMWWFLTIYILLYVIAPFLNKGAELLSKKQYQILLCILLYLDCFSNFIYKEEVGGQLLTFIFVYLLARYIKIYDFKVKRPFLCFCILICLIFAINSLGTLYLNRPLFSATIYNSVLTICGAVCLFFSFKGLSLKKTSWIFKISPLCLGVYLIHFNYFSWNIVIHPILFKIDDFSRTNGHTNLIMYSLLTFTFCIVAFIVCLSIEKLRQIICQPILNFINKQIDRLKLSV